MVFLFVDIWQVEVFYSILSKLWLRLRVKGRAEAEGRPQDFPSCGDDCKSSLKEGKSWSLFSSPLWDFLPRLLRDLWGCLCLSVYNAVLISVPVICVQTLYVSLYVFLLMAEVGFAHTRTHTHRVQCVMVLPVFGRNRPEGKILETVGVFEAVKQHGKYETGQVRHTHFQSPNTHTLGWSSS